MYTAEQVAEFTKIICDRLAQGESLVTICRTPGLPSYRTLQMWLCGNVWPEFCREHARARAAQVEHYVDEMIDIADEPLVRLDNGASDSGAVADKRVRIEARRWYAEKLLPKKYGLKSTTELTGPDGAELKLSEGQVSAKLSALLTLAAARKAAQGDESPADDLSDIL